MGIWKEEYELQEKKYISNFKKTIPWRIYTNQNSITPKNSEFDYYINSNVIKISKVHLLFCLFRHINRNIRSFHPQSRPIFHRF